jgi:hypothetical protein
LPGVWHDFGARSAFDILHHRAAMVLWQQLGIDDDLQSTVPGQARPANCCSNGPRCPARVAPVGDWHCRNRPFPADKLRSGLCNANTIAARYYLELRLENNATIVRFA